MIQYSDRFKALPDPFGEPVFEVGQIVRHTRYDYRGVVVSCDPYCKADDEWYESHPIKPSRSQPWYHILVHESMQNTYAAQENLEPDDDDAPVLHPLVPFFFESFEDGRYIRNDQPWPEDEKA
ncbi:MAG: heat shock protein HspQ [Planctomycetaceae bacterium]|nr:heat shock protein HspQ [Planctomycetaceae bacterium]